MLKKPANKWAFSFLAFLTAWSLRVLTGKRRWLQQSWNRKWNQRGNHEPLATSRPSSSTLKVQVVFHARLSEAQLVYAANDAWAALRVFNALHPTA